MPTVAPYAPSQPPVRSPSSSPVVARPDPLATMQAGNGFSPVDAFSLKTEVDRALTLGGDVPGRVQDGPTCGLYALGMVMDFWDKKDAANLNPLVQGRDVARAGSHSRSADTELRLLDVARARGFTTQGEMFHASQLGELARDFGYTAKTTANFTLDDLHAALDRGNPVLVPFDVDNAGNPGLFNGTRAHWAVIEGHFEEDGVQYLVATHGWTGNEYVYRADEFMQSCFQLNKSTFPGAPADISQTLGGRMVEVSPSETRSADGRGGGVWTARDSAVEDEEFSMTMWNRDLGYENWR